MGDNPTYNHLLTGMILQAWLWVLVFCQFSTPTHRSTDMQFGFWHSVRKWVSEILGACSSPFEAIYGKGLPRNVHYYILLGVDQQLVDGKVDEKKVWRILHIPPHGKLSEWAVIPKWHTAAMIRDVLEKKDCVGFYGSIEKCFGHGIFVQLKDSVELRYFTKLNN